MTNPSPSTEVEEFADSGHIYSPEASDGGTDWPTKLVSAVIILAVILIIYLAIT